MNIRQFIPPVAYILYQKINTKTNYKIGNYTIEIPPGFLLPVFQKSLKLYDRFLPVLAKNISSSQLIIDVGANIGDTAIALLQSCKNPVLCVEPSDIFFPYLTNNLKKLSKSDFSRVKTIKEFIGTGTITGILNHTIGGTATIQVTAVSDSMTHVELDKIVENVSDIILLKVDVDGFDFDVIKSAGDILTNSEPILFWENEISQDFQYEGYNEMYSLLEKKGYKYIFIFDNFGNLITEENDFSTLRNINAYLYSMRKHSCTKTFAYTDILASTEKNYISVKNAINEYKSEWINK